MSLMFPSLCPSCIRYDVLTKHCTAFGGQIPPDILLGYSSHFDPLEDGSDGGLTYEPAEDTEQVIAAYLSFWYDHDLHTGDTPAAEDD